jgi:tetratricopeptide (TPR) repeat protein
MVKGVDMSSDKREPGGAEGQPEDRGDSCAGSLPSEWRVLADLAYGLESLATKAHDALDGRPRGKRRSKGEGSRTNPACQPKQPDLSRAQDLIYEAWDEEGAERVRLARKALEASLDCADAYLILAVECADTLEKKRDLALKGVAAAERALGSVFFEQNAGTFWLSLEARPYMRVRSFLAHCLWGLGERVAATEHYFSLLRLNRDDNQGIRYALADCLLALAWDSEMGRLLREYEWDKGAFWRFNWALWAFRTKGSGVLSRRRLREALEANGYIPDFLLGQRSTPTELPHRYSRGSLEEAALYAAHAATNWQNTDGALEWLAAALSPDGAR